MNSLFYPKPLEGLKKRSCKMECNYKKEKISKNEYNLSQGYEKSPIGDLGVRKR